MIKIMGNQIELLASLGKRLRLLREDAYITKRKTTTTGQYAGIFFAIKTTFSLSIDNRT